MQLASGTLLHGGTYKIDKVLGQGSFGITYLAEHTSLGKKVAIKEFFMKDINTRLDDGSITGITDGSLSHNNAQKFRKEAMNLARIEHPNIVRVTDSFDENGTFYYVMDYIDGQNLNDYLKQYAVSEKVAVDIIKDVANALIYMHEEKHMLHLDLKPGNIMRRASDGHIFLIDFGLSKHFDVNGAPETSTTIGLGTAGYAPIEQANQAKNGEFRPTIDVYALGATLYKLLTRETPPAASELVSDDELIIQALRTKGVSAQLVSVVEKAMMPSVKKRTQSVRAFVDSLPSVGNATSTSTTSTSNVTSEETEYQSTKKTNEETVVESNSVEKHPDFDESTYLIEAKYKNYPTSTYTKANEGNLDAIIAYGMMALRGEGMNPSLGTAYEWFMLAKKKGDDRGEKLIEQWYLLKDKYLTARDIPSEQKEQGCSSVVIEDILSKHLLWFPLASILTAIIGFGVGGPIFILLSDNMYALNETDNYIFSECIATVGLIVGGFVAGYLGGKYYFTNTNSYAKWYYVFAVLFCLDVLSIIGSGEYLEVSALYDFVFECIEIPLVCYMTIRGVKLGNNKQSNHSMVTEFLSNPFSFKGRIRRSEFLYSIIIFYVAYISRIMSMEQAYKSGWNDSSIYLLWLLPLTWFIIAQNTKRCHDLGHNGWWQLIPFYSVAMLFCDSDSEANEYGDNPKGQ